MDRGLPFLWSYIPILLKLRLLSIFFRLSVEVLASLWGTWPGSWLLGSESRVGDLLILWLVLGYYLGGIVTEGGFWGRESRVWGDFVGKQALLVVVFGSK